MFSLLSRPEVNEGGQTLFKWQDQNKPFRWSTGYSRINSSLAATTPTLSQSLVPSTTPNAVYKSLPCKNRGFEITMRLCAVSFGLQRLVSSVGRWVNDDVLLICI